MTASCNALAPSPFKKATRSATKQYRSSLVPSIQLTVIHFPNRNKIACWFCQDKGVRPTIEQIVIPASGIWIVRALSQFIIPLNNTLDSALQVCDSIRGWFFTAFTEIHSPFARMFSNFLTNCLSHRLTPGRSAGNDSRRFRLSGDNSAIFDGSRPKPGSSKGQADRKTSQRTAPARTLLSSRPPK